MESYTPRRVLIVRRRIIKHNNIIIILLYRCNNNYIIIVIIVIVVIIIVLPARVLYCRPRAADLWIIGNRSNWSVRILPKRKQLRSVQHIAVSGHDRFLFILPSAPSSRIIVLIIFYFYADSTRRGWCLCHLKYLHSDH